MTKLPPVRSAARSLSTPSYAAMSAGQPLRPYEIERRPPGPDDVLCEILFCGICHSDIHFVRGQFPGVPYPAVPGHEIVARIVKAGTRVSRFRPGEIVGIGCMVGSCRHCSECELGEEQFCSELVTTFGGIEKESGKPTYGGYSKFITVDSDFLLRIPEALPPAVAAPLLCAGITTYAPLRHWEVGPATQCAVIGMGGLGHLAVKFASAMGAEVTVFSTSEAKKADAHAFGASDFAVVSDPLCFTTRAGRYDLILNTVSSHIDYGAFIRLLRRDGTLVLAGVPDAPVSFGFYDLLIRRRNIGGTSIGSIRQTQEMLDFCAEKGLQPATETISIQDVNRAHERVLKSEVRYRFVIDLATLT
jgi:alcohol dehydrogenase (NADP+)